MAKRKAARRRERRERAQTHSAGRRGTNADAAAKKSTPPAKGCLGGQRRRRPETGTESARKAQGLGDDKGPRNARPRREDRGSQETGAAEGAGPAARPEPSSRARRRRSTGPAESSRATTSVLATPPPPLDLDRTGLGGANRPPPDICERLARAQRDEPGMTVATWMPIGIGRTVATKRPAATIRHPIRTGRRHRQGGRRAVRRQRGTEGRGEDHRARPASLGARSSFVGGF